MASTDRRRRPKPEDPNARTSAYDVYDNYLNINQKQPDRNSGVGAVGLGFLNGDMSDSDDEQESKPQPKPVPAPIAAPRPGYAAPIAALNLARPDPSAVPAGRQPDSTNPFESQNPFEPSARSPHSATFPVPAPAPPRPSLSVPSTPHPLQPPMTPITPVFARPKSPHGPSLKFSEPIMRGNAEETLLPRRGERGDDFWRRFSMVVKAENSKSATEKQSTWLRKTQSGLSRLSMCTYIVGFALLLCIAGAIFLGWYASHNSSPHQQPKAIGGSANEKANVTTSVGALGDKASSGPNGVRTSLHVSPTFTVARRATPTAPVKRHRRDGVIVF